MCNHQIAFPNQSIKYLFVLILSLFIIGCSSDKPIDRIAPVISISGDNPVDIEFGTTYTDQGATATDDRDGNVSVNVSGSVDTDALGEYTITYGASDSAGNTSSGRRTVNVVDRTAPVISINGPNPTSIDIDSTYNDEGAKAIDNVDGDITVTVSNTVDTATIGEYSVTYTATDASGNTSEDIRVVNVTNNIGISSPENGVTYKNSVPLELIFSNTVTQLEITDLQGNVIYFADSILEIIESLLDTESLNDGANTLTIKATFATGDTVEKERAFFLQKNIEPTSTLTASSVFLLDIDSIAQIDTSFSLTSTESIPLIVENTYSDEFIKTCSDDLVIESSNTTIATAQSNVLTALAPGVVTISLYCADEPLSFELTVIEDSVNGLEIKPKYILIEGIGSKENISVTEFTSLTSRPATNTIPDVTDSNIINVDGLEVIALNPGRTQLTVSQGAFKDVVDVEVVPDLSDVKGIITINEGGVLRGSLNIDGVVKFGKAIFRPNSVSLDKEHTLALLTSNELGITAPDDETILSGFNISTNDSFVREILVSLPISDDIKTNQIISFSKVDSGVNVLEREGLAEVNFDTRLATVKVSYSGTYVLHTNAINASQALSLQSKTLRTSSRFKTSDCEISLHTSWISGIDFSNCDKFENNLLRKYKPTLIVAASKNSPNRSLPGELPLRISDLLRGGKLFKNLESSDDEEIDYKVTLGEDFKLDSLNEANANDLLQANNCESQNKCTYLRINNKDISDWHQYKGIPTVYGRVIEDSFRGENFVSLQYWMYYAGSQLPDGAPDLDNNILFHEGDVEFFQVVLNNKLQPIGASTGQHYYGESRDWSNVLKSSSGSPFIYIAEGSHATHFDSSDVLSGTGNFGFLAREENANPAGLNTYYRESLSKNVIRITPSLIETPSNHVFFNWNGIFGDPRLGDKIFDGGTSGPPSPKYRGPGSHPGLSMFLNPSKYHFTFLSPGDNYMGFMEVIASARSNTIKLKDIINGTELTNNCNGESKLSGLMPFETSGIYQLTGFQNYKFQQRVKSCTSGGNINQYFDNLHSGTECATSTGEYISKRYREYVVNPLVPIYEIQKTISLSELIKSTDPTCALNFTDVDNDDIEDSIDTDTDNDGLSDTGEIECGTDPNSSDTDSDASNDQTECAGDTDPTVFDSPNSDDFIDEFDTVGELDNTKWLVENREGCCGFGNIATYSVANGNLNINVPGGSSGVSGVGDTTAFIPKNIGLTGDFYVETEMQELSRTQQGANKDNSGIGIFIETQETKENLIGISILGNYSGYFEGYGYNQYQGHRIQASGMANVVDGVNTSASALRELDLNTLYKLKFRIFKVADIYTIGYLLEGELDWTDFQYTISNNQIVRPIIFAFSGDGGQTSQNGSFEGNVEYFRVSDLKGSVSLNIVDRNRKPTVALAPIPIGVPSFGLPPGSPAYNCPLNEDNLWGDNCVEDRINKHDVLSGPNVVLQIYYDDNANGVWDDSTFICGKTLTPSELSNVDCTN